MKSASIRDAAPHPGPLLSYGLAAYPPGLASPLWRAGDSVWNINYTLAGTVREILPPATTWEHPHDFSASSFWPARARRRGSGWSGRV